MFGFFFLIFSQLSPYFINIVNTFEIHFTLFPTSMNIIIEILCIHTLLLIRTKTILVSVK